MKNRINSTKVPYWSSYVEILWYVCSWNWFRKRGLDLFDIQHLERVWNLADRSMTTRCMFRRASIYSHPAGYVSRPNKRFWWSISLTFLWTHTRAYVNMWHDNITESLETPSCFMDVLHCSLQRKWDDNFAHCDTHYGLVCVWNMNVCAVCSQSMLYQHLSSSKSWSSSLLQCLTVLLSSFGCICDLVERFHDAFELMTLLFLKLLEFILNLS